MAFSGPIDTVAETITALVEEWPQGNWISTPVPFSDFEAANPDLSPAAAVSVDYHIELSKDADSDKKKSVEDFEASVQSQSRIFVLVTALTKSADSVFNMLQEKEKNAEPTEAVLDRLALILDLAMWMTQEHIRVTDFHLLLQTVVDSLSKFSTDTVSVFWTYMESRESAFLAHVFDRKITLHRVAMLAICNGLTDQYYKRRKTGKLDSYEKDTFNDNLQSRVRTFLSSLLAFDDLTGLNKYFTIANRANREPHLGSAKSGDEELLQEVLLFFRLLRDPYSHLKNPRMLSKLVDSMIRLSNYLLEEETKHHRKHPSPDIHAVPAPILENEKQTLAKKYESAVFFPEHYWLAPFEPIQRGAQFDAVKEEDKKVAIAQFDSSKFRQLVILQIYMVSCFFLELQNSKKRATLKNINAPASTKHIQEASTPESLIKSFLQLKRDIPRLCRAWDTQLSFLFQQLSQSEENWWAWLLYGKKSDGTSLLSENVLTDDEISTTREKFETVIPYKTKRYFNTHVTPQLSRRMKVKTGLELLRTKAEVEYDLEIEKIDKELLSADLESKPELIEKRTVLIWKKLKYNRNKQWLSFGEVSAELVENNDLTCSLEKEKLKEEQQRKRKVKKEDLHEEKLEKETDEVKSEVNADIVSTNDLKSMESPPKPEHVKKDEEGKEEKVDVIRTNGAEVVGTKQESSDLDKMEVDGNSEQTAGVASPENVSRKRARSPEPETEVKKPKT